MRSIMYKIGIAGILLVGSISKVLAVPPDVFVSTDINTAININVSLSDSGTVSANNSTQGVVIGVSGSAPGTVVFSYTPPNASYNGVDSFVYQIDTGTAILSATVTIQVGPYSSSGLSVAGTPEFVSLQHIDNMCSSSGGQAPPSLTAFCTDFSLATPSERARIARETAPMELGGQNQMASVSTSQQLDNVRRRMAVLRQGLSGAGALSGLQLRWQDKAYAVNDILGDTAYGEALRQSSGGAAAADGNERLSAFANGSFGGGSHDSSLYEDGYSLSNRSLTAGVDYRFNDKLVGGVALGSTHAGMDVDANGGSVSSRGISLLGYGSYYISAQSYVEAIWSLHKNSMDATRNIDYSVQGVAKHASAISSTNNAVTSLSIGTGYETYFSKGVTMTLSANLDWLNSGFDGYAESGAQDKNLVVSKREISQRIYTLNSRFNKAVSLPSGVLIPQLDFTWKHDFSDSAETMAMRYRADPSKRYFYINSEIPDSDYFQLNLGTSYVLPGGNTGFIYYEKTLGRSGYSIYNLSLGYRMNI